MKHLAFVLVLTALSCGQNIYSLPGSGAPLELTVQNARGILLTCKSDKQGVHDCKLKEGATLDEVMTVLVDTYSACYTREGLALHPNRGEDTGDCMYNGASFRDWDKYAEVLESSKKSCRARKGKGDAPYYVPMTQQMIQMSCNVILIADR